MYELRRGGAGALSGYMEQLELKRIFFSKNPVRDRIEPLDELRASILEKGLLEPIVVRPVEGGYEVVAGNRRLEACRTLKFVSVPCHVVDCDDKETYEVSLTENLQRKTLNPIEEGQAFKNYVESHGYGCISELARKIGKSQPYVSRRIALLSLPAEVKEEVMRRRMAASVASELVPLDEETQEELREFITDKKTVTRAEVREIVKHFRGIKRRRGEGASTPPQWSYELMDLRTHIIERTLAKCMASLKESQLRFDDAMSALDEGDEHSWVVREALMWHRRFINSQLDELLRLRKKFRSTPQ